MSISIAYFVSSHGFGHAARAAAVMDAIFRLRGDVHFHIYAGTPLWFFEDSLSSGFQYHPTRTDIGMVQLTPLREDLEATCAALDGFLPFDAGRVADLAAQVRQAGCTLVMCDIAPLGLAVAEQAGLPSLLVENFTWDWIYEGCHPRSARLERHVAYLRTQFGRATYRIQAEPVCQPLPCDLTVGPVARRPKQSRQALRGRLGIPDSTALVLVTMGGTPNRYSHLPRLEAACNMQFVVPGAARELQHRGPLLLLPEHSTFYHPDLVHSADAVMGKVGYSTLAEVYRVGLPIGYITRPGFRESGLLEAFITSQMPALRVPQEAFESGRWEALAARLLALPKAPVRSADGADAVARFVVDLLPRAI